VASSAFVGSAYFNNYDDWHSRGTIIKICTVEKIPKCCCYRIALPAVFFECRKTWQRLLNIQGTFSGCRDSVELARSAISCIVACERWCRSEEGVPDPLARAISFLRFLCCLICSASPANFIWSTEPSAFRQTDHSKQTHLKPKLLTANGVARNLKVLKEIP